MTEIQDLRARMENTISSFQKDLAGLRTGRASVGLLDKITVDSYGSMVPLNQVGNISAPEPRLLTIQVWDKTMVPIIEKAIVTSDLGLNPSSDGQLIRIPMPDMTEERRKEMVKIGGGYSEKAKIAIRNIRKDGMDSIKKAEKDGDISQDEMHGKSDEIQKATDEFVKKIDDLFAEKEKDIMTV